MASLVVEGTTPVLLVGQGDRLQGEIWLTNPTGADVTLTSATLTVTMGGATETGPIVLPQDAFVPASSTRRLAIGLATQPSTPPGTFNGQIDLVTSAGNQTIPAT